MSHPDDSRVVGAPSTDSSEVHLKFAPTLDDFGQQSLAEAAAAAAAALETAAGTSLALESRETGVAEGPDPSSSNSIDNPFLTPRPPPVVATQTLATPRSRQHHILMDLDGRQKKFGSALGLLTAKFVEMILSSESCCLDMNETASTLGVPKRRLYDITNVLEGVGILEKRSKNTVAWKGSEAILGEAIDKDAKAKIDELRAGVSSCHQEEMKLDEWISQIMKLAPSAHKPVWTKDIIQALFYHGDAPPEALTKEALVDETTGKPRQTILAVHAPYDSVAQIQSTSGSDDFAGRRLFLGCSEEGVDKYAKEDEDPAGTSDCTPSRKRRLCLDSRLRAKGPRIDDKVEIYVIPTSFDEQEQKLKAQDRHQATPVAVPAHVVDPLATTDVVTAQQVEHIASTTEPTKLDQITDKSSATWELVNEAGVTELFGTGGEGDADPKQFGTV